PPPPPPRPPAPPGPRGKHGREQREICDERRIQRNGDPEREATVGGHDVRYPVKRSGEVHQSGNPSEQKRTLPRPRERDHQRAERNPAAGGMTEFRKAEREE